MSSTTTVETLPVGGGGGGGGGGGPFPGYRNAPISNSATPIPPQQLSTSRPNTSRTRQRLTSESADHNKGDAGPTSATPVSRPISNATSYYRGNPNMPDGGSPYVNGNQTPSGASPTKSRVMSPTKEQRSPSKTPSRAQSAMNRSRQGDYDESGGEGSGRSKSRLEYHGFEEYDGGRLSRVGRQTPAVMVPPGWPEPELKKVEPLTLSTPTHKPRQPRSVSAYGGRRRPSASQSVNDFQQLSSEFLTEKLKSSEGYKDPAESSYSRPTTQMYKSLKNLSQGEYMPSVERNTPMPAYTPSPMESSSYQPPKQGIPKSISYSNNFSASNTPDNVDMANRTMNTALNTSAIGTETTYNPGVGESNKDTSLHALRESNTPRVGPGGRDPDTGLYPSPTHAVRNQFGTNKSFAASSYDIRAENNSSEVRNEFGTNKNFSASSYDVRAENTSSESRHVSNEGYMSPKKSASRPFTAAPGTPLRRSSRSMMNLARNAEPQDYAEQPPSMSSETTSKRAYRYDNEGFQKARSKPFTQEAQVKIAIEGKRYMSPEKKEVFIGYPDHHARQPFTPRHTPSYAFPPPGSDIRRHGNTDFMVSGSNVYNRNAPNQGMDYGASRPSTGFESGAPMVYGHSISGSGSEASGGSAGMGGKPRFAFKTNTTGGTTTRSTHRDFGVLGEDFRPRILRPWSSIRTGKEGTFDDRVTSREQYTYRQYVPRIYPDVRRENLKTASQDERMNSLTTYRKHIENEDVTMSPRKRAIRYNPAILPPDNIDWL